MKKTLSRHQELTFQLGEMVKSARRNTKPEKRSKACKKKGLVLGGVVGNDIKTETWVRSRRDLGGHGKNSSTHRE